MENWTRWEPINNLSEKYYVDSFCLSDPELDIIITLFNCDKSKKIKIRFNGIVGSFRYTNKNYCSKMLDDIFKKYGADFYSTWSFFKIANSNYLKWLSYKSCTLSDVYPFQHYCIIGGDEIIDILASFGPKTTIII